MKIEVKGQAYTEGGHKWLKGTLVIDDKTSVPCSLMGYNTYQETAYESDDPRRIYLRIDNRHEDGCLVINGVEVIVDGLTLIVIRDSAGNLYTNTKIDYRDFGFNFRRKEGTFDRKPLTNSICDKLQAIFGFGAVRKRIELPPQVLGLLRQEDNIKQLLTNSLKKNLHTFLNNMRNEMWNINGMIRMSNALFGGESFQFDADELHRMLTDAVEEYQLREVEG